MIGFLSSLCLLEEKLPFDAQIKSIRGNAFRRLAFLCPHPGLYSMTVDRFSQDWDRSVMDRLKVDRRPL